ncbi:sarcosine oxidase subunit alpha [Xinfangfangia sp. D13-10-4-6]|uniref:2Fe-2S iron-sulfur cluster-binding protein n=1 Tax=Pseudogemmobacter hezensis TaxID=2737662 RepID=UPI0015573EBA|nr:2Fe-2S iron-sulfur cluster-binding protein [Pseudogemmobacter hezensis]NPD16792.1 sarcosine oxidase subunit alpha [Pseudogemmobacter hezensis]
MSATSVQPTIRWNGKSIAVTEGDSLAAALWRAGVTTFARSRKLHRPLAWTGAHAVGALAAVNGLPNTRLDQTPARAGTVVSMQNCWPGPGFDLLRLMQILPERLLYGGFEHGHLMPSSGLSYRLAERMMAYLAGVADTAPTGWEGAAIPGRDITVDHLIIGGGPEGIRAANAVAAAGLSVALVTRGRTPARFARNAGQEIPVLDPRVDLHKETEAFGGYRDGDLVLAAPVNGTGAAVVFRPGQITLATGRRSMPPVVRGNHLPGVFDAHAGLNLAAEHGVRLGRRVAVIGTGDEVALAARLRDLGHEVVHTGPAAGLDRIEGRARVRAIRVAGRRILCDTLVHAGPWRADPNLGFQLAAEGHYQLLDAALPVRVTRIGAATLAPEPIHIPAQPDKSALICPCMDVTLGELLSHIDAGEHDPEILKRLTSCGMGTCQGWPCWDSMLAVLAARTGTRPEDHARPSHRPPRRAITIAQAAGLAGLVEPDK